MKKLHTHITRFITFIVALQILNMGLFVQDFESLAPSTLSNLDYNVINSVVEYVSEVVLNKTNAIPENNNKSNKDLQGHKHFVVKIVELKKQPASIPQLSFEPEISFAEPENLYYQFCKEITPPPPKA